MLLQQPMANLRTRNGGVKPEPLDDIAAHGLQRPGLWLVLHPFSQNRQAHFMSNPNHRPQYAVRCFRQYIVDEPFVQLDSIHRILLKIREGGEAMAKVVQGDANPIALERLHIGLDGRQALGGYALRQFKNQ